MPATLNVQRTLLRDRPEPKHTPLFDNINAMPYSSFSLHILRHRFLRVPVLLFGLIGGYAVSPFSAHAETIADALSAAYQSSDLLQQNRALLRAADEDVAIAVSALRPQINANTSIAGQNQAGAGGESLTATINLTGALTVFDFGSTKLAIDAQKEAVLAARQDLLNAEQTVLINSLRAYMNVIQSQKVADLRDNNVQLIEQQLLAAQDRFDVGEITRTEVSLAESRLARAKGDLATAQGDLVVAREEYKAVVGRYPNNLQPPPRLPEIPPSLTATRAVALQEAPSIVKLRHELKANELNIERAIANSRGSVSLNATLEANRSDVEPITRGSSRKSLNLALRVPIYTGGNNDALYRQAVARSEATRANLQFETINITRQASNAWSNLKVSDAQIETNKLRVAASRIALDGVNEEVRLGARTTLDALNAEQELLDAQTALVQAEVNRYVRVYELLESIGLMTVKHLGLDVETYDVTEYYRQVENAPLSDAVGFRLRKAVDSTPKTGEDSAQSSAIAASDASGAAAVAAAATTPTVAVEPKNTPAPEPVQPPSKPVTSEPLETKPTETPKVTPEEKPKLPPRIRPTTLQADRQNPAVSPGTAAGKPVDNAVKKSLPLLEIDSDRIPIRPQPAPGRV